jgi:outer membrane protein assembly factor BamD (BamD/ComL family)
VQARLTVDELYHAAETALTRRDTAAADRAFDRLIAEYPASPLAEQALYERARIAHQGRAWGAARRHLDRLLALPNARLAEPARYLVCRIAVEARDAEAANCLIEYRKAYPRSPHDRDVLGFLVQLDHATGGCAAARARIAELVRTHPRSGLATAWRTRCPVEPPR